MFHPTLHDTPKTTRDNDPTTWHDDPTTVLEFISKLGDYLKGLDETAYWLELLVESEIIPAAQNLLDNPDDKLRGL